MNRFEAHTFIIITSGISNFLKKQNLWPVYLYRSKREIDKIAGEKEGSFLKLHVDINMKMD